MSKARTWKVCSNLSLQWDPTRYGREEEIEILHLLVGVALSRSEKRKELEYSKH